MSEPQKKNLNFIYDFNFFMYNLSGFGILENSEKWKDLLYSIYYKIMNFIYFIMICLHAADAYLVMDDKEKLNLNLCITIGATAATFKIWTLIKKLNVVVDIRKKFRENFNLPYVGREEAHEKILGKGYQWQSRITKTLILFAIPLVAIWVAFPLLDPNSKERRYCLPFPLFKEAPTPTYEIVYTFQTFFLVHFISNVMNNDLMIIGFLIRLCGQFDILIYNISKIKDVYPEWEFEKFVPEYRGMEIDDDEDFRQRSYTERQDEVENGDGNLKYEKNWRRKETLKLFRQNVVHHTCILQQLKDITYAYGGQLFIQVIGGALIIGVVAFGVILQSKKFNAAAVQQFLYVGAVSTDIFVFCYYGTQIKEKSKNVAEALYDTPWYEMDITNRKICSFMIARARKHARLKAQYLFNLDLETYQSMVKTSYNLLAILND